MSATLYRLFDRDIGLTFLISKWLTGFGIKNNGAFVDLSFAVVACRHFVVYRFVNKVWAKLREPFQ